MLCVLGIMRLLPAGYGQPRGRCSGRSCGHRGAQDVQDSRADAEAAAAECQQA
jgi:hypothetical protein